MEKIIEKVIIENPGAERWKGIECLEKRKHHNKIGIVWYPVNQYRASFYYVTHKRGDGCKPNNRWINVEQIDPLLVEDVYREGRKVFDKEVVFERVIERDAHTGVEHEVRKAVRYDDEGKKHYI